MIATLLASAAILAAPVLAGAGQAIVINECDYGVQMDNVPASGGGQTEVSQTLQPGGTYSQVWTELSNGNGWSIKLSKGGDMTNILQYEYTFHNDGTIWYDLSEVNGNPWEGNWEITGSDGCSPRQAAYRYDTDDAYGMQSCADSSTITVKICSGTGHGGTPGESSPAESAPAYSSPAASTPAASSPSPYSSPAYQYGPPGDAAKFGEPAPAPSTLVKEKIHRAGHDHGATVTNVHTEYITHYVTASPLPKRHEHHAHHHA